jgi:membrane protein DedA with SNARE-associated domain
VWAAVKHAWRRKGALWSRVGDVIRRLLRREHITSAQRFYDRHGGKAIILARFFPILRTFAPFLAGVGSMRYSAFIAFNVVGALLWVTGACRCTCVTFCVS